MSAYCWPWAAWLWLPQEPAGSQELPQSRQWARRGRTASAALAGWPQLERADAILPERRAEPEVSAYRGECLEQHRRREGSASPGEARPEQRRQLAASEPRVSSGPARRAPEVASRMVEPVVSRRQETPEQWERGAEHHQRVLAPAGSGKSSARMAASRPLAEWPEQPRAENSEQSVRVLPQGLAWRESPMARAPAS